MVKKKSNQAVEEEVQTEEVKPVEVKVNRFKNNSQKGIKIKLIDGKTFKWITVKAGDIVTIPEKIAKANKLVKVE